jgi:hypothetical protein
MIPLDRLVQFFEETRQLRREGRAAYDVDGVCRWSYFLVDEDRGKLTLAGRFLEQQGYEVIGFLEPGVDDESRQILLRFDKVEQHTPQTLFERNKELHAVAREFALEDYDGMDVGAVDGP